MTSTIERKPWSLIEHIGGKCPSCGGTDIQRAALAGGHSDHEETVAVAYRCMNPSCPAQLAARIEHLCSRKCLDIEGIGAEAADALAELLPQYTAPRAPNLLDLLNLGTNMLAGLRWATASGGAMTFGESRAKKAYAAFQRAKDLPLHRWLFALGIPSIGENTSKEIGRLCEEVNELRYACRPVEPVRNPLGGVMHRIAQGEDKASDALAKFNISSHLGPVSCRALVAFCSGAEGMSILAQLDDWGVKSANYNPIPVKVETGSAFNGKIVVITGTLSVSRDEMKALLEQAGAKVGGSVSAKTNFLVVGEKAGSKAEKAAKLGVTVLTEAQARAML